MFAEKEIAYFQSQPLARLATVAEDGQPDNTVLAFEYDGAYFYVGSVKPDSSRKYKNLRAGNDLARFRGMGAPARLEPS